MNKDHRHEAFAAKPPTLHPVQQGGRSVSVTTVPWDIGNRRFQVASNDPALPQRSPRPPSAKDDGSLPPWSKGETRYAEMRQRIVMVGDDIRAGGGMAAVAEICRSHGLSETRDIFYVSTYLHSGRATTLWHFAQALATVTRQLARSDVRGLHIHTAARGSFWRNMVIAELARLAGKSYILHVHDGFFPTFYRRQPRLQKRLVLRTLRAARRVICLTTEWGRIIQSLDPGIAVSVVPNPVVPDVAACRRRAESKIEDGLVLFFGRLSVQKGVLDLLSAAALLSGRYPGFRLVLAGDGELELVRKEVLRLGLVDRVELPGWVSGAHRADLLSRAQLLVLPSHFEGLPMSILEAMELGIPVVATRVGGIPELLRDGMDGYLVPPHDPAALAEAMSRVLKNPHQARELGRSARVRIHDNFLPQHIIPRIHRVYDEVFGTDRMANAGPR